ncbi:MAG: hypothetical protein AAGC49_12205 [Brevundimonas sp.]
MHPDLYLAMHRERERELVGRLERARVLSERTPAAAPSRPVFERLSIDVRRAVESLAARARALTETSDANSCCATA